MSGYLARMGEMRNLYRILVGKPGKREHLHNLGISERTILK
jgi:hypothetical protein